MFGFIIFDFIYTDILVKELISTDIARDTDDVGVFFTWRFYKTSKENPEIE